MLQVRKTKYPSMRQMEKMIRNLGEKYKCSATIQPWFWVFKSGKFELRYWVNGKGFSGFQDTWEDLQAEYRRLMKGN